MLFLTFLSLADVRIFDDQVCRRSYGHVYDPNTEICAGDYDQKKDTMVNVLLSRTFLQIVSLPCLEWGFRWSVINSSTRWSMGCSRYHILWFSHCCQCCTRCLCQTLCPCYVVRSLHKISLIISPLYVFLHVWNCSQNLFPFLFFYWKKNNLFEGDTCAYVSRKREKKNEDRQLDQIVRIVVHTTKQGNDV